VANADSDRQALQQDGPAGQRARPGAWEVVGAAETCVDLAPADGLERGGQAESHAQLDGQPGRCGVETANYPQGCDFDHNGCAGIPVHLRLLYREGAVFLARPGSGEATDP